MKEKDAAEILGDAIRERAPQLREVSEPLNSLDKIVTSIGWAVGSSDVDVLVPDVESEDGGGVEAAPNSVIAHYFLKSHGGAHAVQCVFSLLALVASLGSLWKSPLQPIFFRRACLFAMMKHTSGLLGAMSAVAQALPDIGFRQARARMEKLAMDPVSQYVFYSACIYLWSTSNSQWYSSVPILGPNANLVLLSPIILRELVSTIFVVSDIMVLWIHSASKQGPFQFLRIGHGFANAIMSLLITPSKWREASAAQRQVILANLVSQASLVAEVLVGVLFAADAFGACWSFFMSTKRPLLVSVAKRCICARLYLNFLIVRRKKIVQLTQTLRGGMTHVPHRVLDALLDPRGAMGISGKQEDCDGKDWGENVWAAFGLAR